MRYHILTLFPEMIRQAASYSILGRAVRNGCISIDTINIRDFADNRYGKVDDYPYGGGAGMVMQAEPVFRAVQSAKEKAGEAVRVIYMTPQAEVLNQTKVEQLSCEEDLIILCGHYEGIDERVLQEVVTDYVSIGDYVLTGGELGALVLMDAVSRFVPGVLGNEESSTFESLQDNLLEYPHYTRPEVWHDRAVPAVLLSGDHRKVEEWRRGQSVQRTEERRPDLLRRGYSFYGLCSGSEEVSLLAGRFMRMLARYSALLDYNRRKLQKQRRKFGPRDLAVFAEADAPPTETQKGDVISGQAAEMQKEGVISGQTAEMQKEGVISGQTAEMQKKDGPAGRTAAGEAIGKADGTLAAASAAESAFAQRYRNVTADHTPAVMVYIRRKAQEDFGGDQEGKIQAERTAFLEKRGFCIIGEYVLRPDVSDEEIRRITLDVRERIEERLQNEPLF